MKIIGQWQNARLIQTGKDSEGRILARVAHVDRRVVSQEYRLVRFMNGGTIEWRDDTGDVPLSEILTYEGWGR